MAQVLMMLLVGLTSAVAYAIGARRLGLRAAALPMALSGLLRCAGTIALFFIANVVLGLVLILTIRDLTATFLSVYLLDDEFLLYLSVCQGIAFECWRARRQVSSPVRRE